MTSHVADHHEPPFVMILPVRLRTPPKGSYTDETSSKGAEYGDNM